MSRFPKLTMEQMSEAQRAVAAQISAGPRGEVRGPFIALIHNAELSRRIHVLQPSGDAHAPSAVGRRSRGIRAKGDPARRDDLPRDRVLAIQANQRDREPPGYFAGRGRACAPVVTLTGGLLRVQSTGDQGLDPGPGMN